MNLCCELAAGVACEGAAGHAHRHDLHVRNVSQRHIKSGRRHPFRQMPTKRPMTIAKKKKKPRERLHHRRSPDPAPTSTPPPPRLFSIGDRKPGDTRMSDRRRIRGEMAAKNWREIKWKDKEPRGKGVWGENGGVESERG